MNSLHTFKKKLSIILTVCISVMGLSIMQTARADAATDAGAPPSSGQILTQIRDLTFHMLQKIHQTTMSWISPDDSLNSVSVIPNNQYGFALLSSKYSEALGNQINLTQTLSTQYQAAGATSAASAANANTGLIYSSLLTQPGSTAAPMTSQQKDALAQSYISAAAGVGFTLTPPPPLSPTSTGAGFQKYQSFYNTLTAIESFDIYAISGLARQHDVLRNYLIQQASNSTWFEQVATEPLGLVLRQILMYNSQIYVQLDRMLKVQQQQLAAQAMTNTLLIIQDNQTVGIPLYNKAGH